MHNYIRYLQRVKLGTPCHSRGDILLARRSHQQYNRISLSPGIGIGVAIAGLGIVVGGLGDVLTRRVGLSRGGLGGGLPG